MNIDHDKEWDADDATWKLLGEAEPRRASGRFADDALRAVRLLPNTDSRWAKFLGFAPWAGLGVAAYAVLVAFLLIQSPDGEIRKSSPVVTTSVTSAVEKWGEIAEVADIEMLSAAADDLELFSDQELVSLVGF